jgi:hypothetical protein
MFPPWIESRFYPGGARQQWRLGHFREDRPPAALEPEIVEVDYRRMLTEIGVGEAFVLALYLTWGTTPPKRIPAAPRRPESKEQIQEDVEGLIAALRQNLRIKVGWDESKIDRLIELERERLGNLPLQTLMGAAIERWERDNR